jgi:NAD(P)-dependent dehydrogenase (short-subunit alcohol dehydrogenase family)
LCCCASTILPGSPSALTIGAHHRRSPSALTIGAHLVARLRRLRRLLGERVVAVEHIGSTAVPGLPAKPIIDLAVGVLAPAGPGRIHRGQVRIRARLDRRWLGSATVARVFVTGSSDGLGLTAARLLAAEGHTVILHARDESRGAQAHSRVPGAAGVVVGDVQTLDGMRLVADQVNSFGRFDAIVHNAGVGSCEQRQVTADGLELLFAVNTLAPYVLTELIERPSRLVYLSSNMHTRARADLADAQWEHREWSGWSAYSETKLYVVALAFGLARRWPRVRCNVVDPGWVATRMGGPGGSPDLVLGSDTQAWLAVSDDPEAAVSGGYFRHRARADAHPAAHDPDFQEGLFAYCAELSGTKVSCG